MKKITSQDAFNQLIRDGQVGSYVPDELKDVEDGFGQTDQEGDSERSSWWVVMLSLMLGLGMLLVVTSMFYWFVGNNPEPAVVIKNETSSEPAVISEVEAKRMIQANLKAFLLAENNEDRARYIFEPDREIASLHTYYMDRKKRETPLWKIERIEPMSSEGSEIWIVVFRDLKKRQQAVSFERYGDNYLLHWSAMKAFGELTWEEFILNRPEVPVMMRAYFRFDHGMRPLAAGADQYDVYIIEDRNGLFSKSALIGSGSHGYHTLKNLSQTSRHPVTLKLVYRETPFSGGKKVLMIDSLVHLRWQKLSGDSQFQEE